LGREIQLQFVQERSEFGLRLGVRVSNNSRPSVELAALCREGARAAVEGQGGRSDRLLDLGVPQVGAAGVRGAERPPFYPLAYEGEEASYNVFYGGSVPSNKAVPSIEYLMSDEGGGVKRWVLEGTDYVYPRTSNKIIRAFLHAKGVSDADIRENYTPFGFPTGRPRSRQSRPSPRRARRPR
jgi:Periplasmic binding protein domain